MPKIRWFAFVPALILAPLAVGIPAAILLWLNFLVFDDGINVLTFVLGIAVYATAVGAPTYLLFGTPAFIKALRDNPKNPPTATYAVVANLISAPFLLVVLLLFQTTEELATTAFITGFGLVFAPLWGAVFGLIYTSFVRKGDELRARADASRATKTAPPP